MQLELSRQIFQKSSNTKCHENPSSGSHNVPFGQTGRYNEANSRFPPFCEHVSKEKDSKQILANIYVPLNYINARAAKRTQQSQIF
jgi:hypothetical protein